MIPRDESKLDPLTRTWLYRAAQHADPAEITRPFYPGGGPRLPRLDGFMEEDEVEGAGEPGGPDAPRHLRRWLEGLQRRAAALLPGLEAARPALAGPDLDNVRRLAAAVGLDDLEVTLLVAAVRCHVHPVLRRVFRAALAGGSEEEGQRRVGTLLGLDPTAVKEALAATGKLVASGFLVGEHDDTPRRAGTPRFLAVSPDLGHPVARAASTDTEFFTRFYRPGPAPKLKTTDYPHLAATVRVAMALVDGALSSREPGVNVLLHGPPGTGKTELARAVAAEVEGQLVEVFGSTETGRARSGHDRLNVFRILPFITRMLRRPVILLDDMDDAFDMTFSWGRDTEVAGHACVHEAMEKTSVPALWVVNDVTQLSSAMLRRFTMVVEVLPPPLQVRRSLVNARLAGFSLPPELLERLARDNRVTPAVVDSVARLARSVTSSRFCPGPGELPRHLGRVLEPLLRATGGPRLPELAVDAERYDLSLVNADVDMASVVEQLCRKGSGRALFHGPPGSGKTELAKEIARRSGRTVLAKRASDLLGKWVGESEKHVAAMFAEASATDAVLVLDEADGLVRERSGAMHHWELTQTNEMLSQMEAFDGLFICTTNLVEAFDRAAMRRFDLKVRFSPLTSVQRWEAFRRSAAHLGLAEPVEDDATRARAVLAGLGALTVGDFRAAERRLGFTSDVSVRGLLRALEGEQREKRMARVVGFAGGPTVEQGTGQAAAEGSPLHRAPGGPSRAAGQHGEPRR
jgi:SpoVK/Ycf46/Vps4 family AAA+-type ATPase